MSEVREDAVEKAARLGLQLLQPLPDEIFVDIDSEEAMREHELRWLKFKNLFDDAKWNCSKSQTEGHFHIIVQVPSLAPLADHERIALQASLGSDPMREMLAILHGRSGYKYTSVFFEKKAT